MITDSPCASIAPPRSPNAGNPRTPIFPLIVEPPSKGFDFTLLAGTLSTFGAIVRDRRTRSAMTLDDLAAATGISKPYLSLIETARVVNPPAPGKVAVLERVLKLPRGTLAQRADLLRTPPSVLSLIGDLIASRREVAHA